MIRMYNTKTFTEIYDSATAFTTDYSTIDLGGITDSSLVTKLYYLLYAKYGNSPIANLDETQWKYKLFSIIFQYGPNWEKELSIQGILRDLNLSDLVDEGQIQDVIDHDGTNTQTVSNTGTVGTSGSNTYNNLTSTDSGSDIHNHAYNPATDPSTQTTTELNYIDEQHVDKFGKTNTMSGSVANASTQTNNLTTGVKAADTANDTMTKTMTAGKLRGYEKLLALLNSNITDEFLSKFGPLFQKVINLRPYLFESED